MPADSLHQPAGIVASAAQTVVQAAETEWMMDYAAALGEDDARYFDTTRPDGIVAHPVFPVCPEWPAWLQTLQACVAPALLERGVHATQELHWHRPLRSGETLHTHGRVGAVRQRRSGLHVTTTLETRDADGAPLFDSRSGLLLRGVNGHDEGDDDGSSADLLPSVRFADTSGLRWHASRALQPQLAHVYSACARIRNPIHTDAACARRVGLPGIILHGTATLALSVSELSRREGHDRHVRDLAARFLAPVCLPATLRIECIGHLPADGRYLFRALLADDGTVACIGTVSFAEPA